MAIFCAILEPSGRHLRAQEGGHAPIGAILKKQSRPVRGVREGAEDGRGRFFVEPPMLALLSKQMLCWEREVWMSNGYGKRGSSNFQWKLPEPPLPECCDLFKVVRDLAAESP